MIENILTWVIYFALASHIFLLSYAVWRVWSGENTVDRLLASELVGTLVLAVLILITLVERNSLFVDVALAMGVLGFIGIVTYAKYATDQRMS